MPKAESESFQIMVLNPNLRDLPEVDLRASQWRYAGDRPGVGAPVLGMFKEHYVKVKKSSGTYWKAVKGRLRKGMYPDARVAIQQNPPFRVIIIMLDGKNRSKFLFRR